MLLLIQFFIKLFLFKYLLVFINGLNINFELVLNEKSIIKINSFVSFLF